MIDKQKSLMKNIEYYGKEYLNCFPQKSVLSSGFDNLNELKKELNNSWWESLKYLLHHNFMRGRKDELSDKYFEFAINKLNNYFKYENIDSYERFQKYKKNYKVEFEIKNKKDYNNFIEKLDNTNEIVNILKNDNKVNKVSKSLKNYKDIIMVLGVLNFVSNVTTKDKNITNYFIKKIKNGDVKECYDNLTGIKFIGPKIASFYLRNLARVYKIREISEENLKYFFPMDTWIIQVCQKVGIIDNNKLKEFEVREKIISKCLDNDINPLLFNQGCWFVGYFSFDLLINLLKIFEKNLKLKELDIVKSSIND